MVVLKQVRDTLITDPKIQIDYLHGEASGYIAFFRKALEGSFQRHYKLDDIKQHLSEWVTFDSYMSMNTFYTPKRLITNLKEIRTAFVDIDCYNSGFTVEQVEAQLKEDYFGQEIPTPNMIIHSGRGINLIWFLEPLSGLAVERWDKLQNAIFSKVKSLGADKKATDAARVFRIAGSVNSKNNEIVYCELLHEYKYGFDEMIEEYFPNILKSVQKPKKKPQKRAETSSQPKGVVRHLFNEYTLIRARMDDIKRLVTLRGGNMSGCREYALFLYRYWSLVQTDDKEKAMNEMLKVNDSFSDPLPTKEALADTKSAERYYDSDEPFKITNETVIKWLNIKPEEQSDLQTIISRSEKRKRNTEYQRKKRGSVSLEEYEINRQTAKSEKLQKLKDLLAQNPEATQRELAEMMGMSQSSIYKLLKEL